MRRLLLIGAILCCSTSISWADGECAAKDSSISSLNDRLVCLENKIDAMHTAGGGVELKSATSGNCLQDTNNVGTTTNMDGCNGQTWLLVPQTSSLGRSPQH